MPQLIDQKVVEWRDADTRARAAEQALNKLLFGKADKLPPGADLAREARRLRQLADEKLKAALAAMRVKP
jgi:hypothetical protein